MNVLLDCALAKYQTVCQTSCSCLITHREQNYRESWFVKGEEYIVLKFSYLHKNTGAFIICV